MANPIVDFINKNIVKPQVDKETSSLKKELGRAKSKLEEKSFDLLTGLSGRFGVNNSIMRQRVLDSYLSWAYANINAIAEKVADIHFELYRFNGFGAEEELEQIHGHPALDLLLKVNDFQTKWDLIYVWTCHILTYGEAFWYEVGRSSPNMEPTEIWPLRPDYMKVIPGDLEKNEFIKQYEYEIPGKEKIIFKPWEILFFRIPHPTNAYRGYGIVEAAANDIDIDMYANTFNLNYFKNSARPDAVLESENKLSFEVIERLKTAWNSNYSGSQNNGKTAVLEQGLKYKPISETRRDMEFLEQQKWTRDKLMAMFKNTKVILGITEDVNRANAEASEAVWIKHTIKPKMQRLVDYLNEFFIPMYGENLILGFVDPVPESVELKITTYEKGINKWLTPNEVREQEGLDPVEGGDTLNVTQPAPTFENPNATERLSLRVQTGKGKADRLMKRFAPEVQKVHNRQMGKKRMLGQINKVMATMLGKTVALTPGPISKDVQEKRWETFVKVAEIFEAQLKTMVAAVIKSHEARTLENLRKRYKPKKGLKSYVPDQVIPSADEYVRVSIKGLTPILEALAREQGQDVYDFLGLNQLFEMRESFKDLIEKFAKDSSTSYIKTVDENVSKVIAQGVKQGIGIDEMVKLLQQEYTSISKLAAQRVARTESIRSANAAQEESFKQSGVVEAKQWLTALDERVDDECAALDGKIVDLDDDFTEIDGVPKVYQDIAYPPIHPNCRCTISPVIVKRSSRSKKPKVKDSDIEQIKAELRKEMEQELEATLDGVLRGLNE